jgi:hypothetical protein
MKSLRSRGREVRKRHNLRVWFGTLLNLYRYVPFSREDAYAIAVTTRARRRDVDEVLRELEEDGATRIVDPVAEVFVFVTPCSGLRAA